jgi:hypothetical protein
MEKFNMPILYINRNKSNFICRGHKEDKISKGYGFVRYKK